MKPILESTLGLQRHRMLSQSLNALKRVIRPKHEPEVFALKKLVGGGDIVCEIGANYAQYSRVLSDLVVPQGRVFAFEPAEITYQCLVRNCHILRLINVYPQKLALSDRSGTMEIYTPVKRKGVFGVAQTSLAPDPTTESLKESVRVETLDRFLSDRDVATVSFIRCDVEGAEMSVFLGARDTLARCRPTILVELHPEMMKRFGHTVHQLRSFLLEFGYRFAVWKHETFKYIKTLDTGNVFCLPER